MEDKLPAPEHRMRDRLALNVDIVLNRSLQRALANYARQNANYNPYRLRPNRLAVTVMDPFTGKVLAMPSWPLFDPGKPEYEALIGKIPESTRSRFQYNHNLTNHIAGSTIKPIVFSTMAAALWRRQWDLGQITILNRGDGYSPAPDEKPPIHPHTKVGKIKIAMWDCNSNDPESDMGKFLTKSRDYPEGVLGMLGMVMDEQDISKVLIPTENGPDIRYRGRGYTLDLTKVSETGTAFSLKDQFAGGFATTRAPEAINGTILFDGLSTMFDFNNRDTDEVWLRRSSSNFLPMLSNEKLQLDRNNYIDNIIPASMNMAGGNFQDIRGGLISCFLGGGDCGFNNVRMAEAGARIATGQRVVARLENTPDTAWPDMPEPLKNVSWRNAHIIEPMQEAGEEEGTADVLSSLVRLPAQYKAIYKTGTILEGDKARESETLMFIIGRWQNNAFVRGRPWPAISTWRSPRTKTVTRRTGR